MNLQKPRATSYDDIVFTSRSLSERGEETLRKLLGQEIDHTAIDQFLQLEPNRVAALAASLEAGSDTQRASNVERAIRLTEESSRLALNQRTQILDRMNDATVQSLAARLGFTNIQSAVREANRVDDLDPARRLVVSRLAATSEGLATERFLVQLILQAERDYGTTAPREACDLLSLARFAVDDHAVDDALLAHALLSFANDESLSLPDWFESFDLLNRLRSRPQKGFWNEPVHWDFRIISGLLHCFKPYWNQHLARLRGESKAKTKKSKKLSGQKSAAARKGNSSKAERKWMRLTSAFVEAPAGMKPEPDCNEAPVTELTEAVQSFVHSLNSGSIPGIKAGDARTKRKYAGFLVTLLRHPSLPADDLMQLLRKEGINDVCPALLTKCRELLGTLSTKASWHETEAIGT